MEGNTFLIVMNLREVQESLGAKGLLKNRQKINRNVKVAGVEADSREVEKGDVFIAISGANFDGHDYILKVVKQGAAAVVGERDLDLEIPYFQVESSRKAWAVLCAGYYNNPQGKLNIIGVTGTDGKTTTAHLIHSMLRAGGIRCGLISTVEADLGADRVPSGLHVTTPEPPELFKFLFQMVENGSTHAVLEVTSHALDQERVFGIDFDVGVLTNVTPEHLDYHGGFEKYRGAKAKLFQRSGVSVLNANDSSFSFFNGVSKDLVPYSVYMKGDENQQVTLENLRRDTTIGVSIRKNYPQLPGEYNRENIAAAAAAARYLGVTQCAIRSSLADFSPPEGRFEEVELGQPFKVIVDFAHTPNALKNLLETVRQQMESGRLITVFGCAGERDKGKRYSMGKISAKLADISIFTAEDPRSESVQNILCEMVRGAEAATANHNYFCIPDRKRAICTALEKARCGDWVLILGKGHERSMNIDGREYEWSDKGEAERFLGGEFLKAELFPAFWSKPRAER